MADNLITGNKASWKGSGLFCDHCAATLTNNTIADNPGSAIYVMFNSTAEVVNNILAFNGYGVVAHTEGTVTARNNCLYGNTSGDYSLVVGADDVRRDPQFRDRAAGNYHIRGISPCINAGWNDAVGLPETDIDGQGRICWNRVDIGADEYWPLEVKIDIQPGTDPNLINPRSNGVTPVAVLTTPEFDACTVDPASIRMAGASVAVKARRSMAEQADVDADGDLDLVLHFETQDLVLDPGTTSLILTGRTFDGEYVEGADSMVLSSQ